MWMKFGGEGFMYLITTLGKLAFRVMIFPCVLLLNFISILEIYIIQYNT